MESKTIDGIEYASRAPSQARKLSEMPKDTRHVVVSWKEEPTKFGTYVVSVESGGERAEYFFPAHLREELERGRGFIYRGLARKSDNSGHSYHSVLWERRASE